MIELNMVVFLIILFLDTPHTNYSGVIKYFITQATASRGLIWGVRAGNISLIGSSSFILLRVLLKLGAAPLHFWYIRVLQCLSWEKFLILSTLQKVLPLFLLSSVSGLPSLRAVVLPSLIIGLLVFRQVLLKRILAYSRIFNLSIMIIITEDQISLAYFFMFYFITIIGVTSLLKAISLSRLNTTSGGPSSCIVASLALLARLMGLPPFVGFWVKLIVLKRLLAISRHLLIFALLFSSLFFMVMYVYIARAMIILKQSYRVGPWGYYYRAPHRFLIRLPVVIFAF
jgi:NADH:ubiquinone oxidoreductase subunit 2 (subunit N)